MQKISEHGLLEVLADFDQLDGASPGLVAWELFVTEQEVDEAWALAAAAAGWLPPDETRSMASNVAADRRRLERPSDSQMTIDQRTFLAAAAPPRQRDPRRSKTDPLSTAAPANPQAA